MGAAALATGCASEENPSPVEVRVASIDELEAGPVEFELPGVGRCFAARLQQPADYGQGPDESVVAFSSLCPHMGCPIELDAVDVQTGRFGPCRCHQSLFDIRRDGRMVHGRASSSLARVDLRIADGEVFAVGASRLAFGAALDSETALTTPLDVIEATEDPNGAAR
ncbi:MAG: Rieske 2Fe-2S domain-containing protein [Nannocystaceae bacterium]